MAYLGGRISHKVLVKMLVGVASLKPSVGLEIHVQGALTTSWKVGAGCGQDTLVPYCVTPQETA